MLHEERRGMCICTICDRILLLTYMIEHGHSKKMKLAIWVWLDFEGRYYVKWIKSVGKRQILMWNVSEPSNRQNKTKTNPQIKS